MYDTNGIDFLSCSANEATETLCTVALQAFVESGRWQEAVPFVGQVYGGFENCPAQIIQYRLAFHYMIQAK